MLQRSEIVEIYLEAVQCMQRRVGVLSFVLMAVLWNVS